MNKNFKHLWYIRYRLLTKLDNWSHSNGQVGNTGIRGLFCDAYEFQVTNGEQGKRLWPLTRWSFPPLAIGRSVSRKKYKSGSS